MAVIPFKVVPSRTYTPIPTSFPVFVTILEGFKWYLLEYPRHVTLDVCNRLKMLTFDEFFHVEEEEEVTL